MKQITYSDNYLRLKGRIMEIHEYGKDVANITLSVENHSEPKNGKPAAPINIQLKCFTPAAYNTAKVGMFVEITGRVTTGHYKKNGADVYSQDLVADYIEFLESKQVVEAREAAKNAKRNPNAVSLGE